MKITNAFIILQVLVLTSCVRDAKNVDLPVLPSKIVVTSFISPQDTMLTVSLSLSTALNQYPDINKIDALKYAKVELSDGTKSIILPPMYQDTLYYVRRDKSSFGVEAAVFPILPGRTYQLTVSDVNGQTVTSTTTVPSDNNMTAEAKIYRDLSSKNFYTEKYRIDLDFKDTAGETNYYRLDMGFHVARCYTNSYLEHYYNLVSDVGNDGTVFSIKNGHIDSSCDIMESDSVTIFLANLDINYYKFHFSLDKYVGDDPFSEPVPIFTNIQGGLGCFGSFNLNVKKVSFKVDN